MPKADTLAVAVLCDLFLEHSEKHNSPGSYESYRYYLQSLCDTHDRSLVAAIKPLHVTAGSTLIRPGKPGAATPYCSPAFEAGDKLTRKRSSMGLMGW